MHQMPCVCLVPYHMKQVLQKQQQPKLPDAVWLEAFDLHPKRPLLESKDHPTIPGSSAGSFFGLKPSGMAVNTD